MDSDDSINDCHHTSNDDLAEEQYEDIIASSSDHVDASTWSFLSYTTTGARYTGNLNNRVSVQPDLTLNYNSSDILLLEKTKQGALQALSSTRDKLNKISTESLSAIDCFAAALPREVIVKLFQWLRAIPKNAYQRSRPEVNFADYCIFMRLELKMRIYGISSHDLKFHNCNATEFEIYERFRKAMAFADKPAYKRPPLSESAGSLPAFTFDPIMKDVKEILNREWSRMFFVYQHSWLSIDDDKLPYCSKKWKEYGLQMTPTKDKKLKPVIHTAACVGTGFIVAIYPHTIGSNLCSMMTEMVNTMDPSRNDAIRSQITIFIDRGYLQLAKPQVEPVTNLIQLMQNNLKVRFLGTIKNTPAFPFIIDVNNTENST